MAAKLKLQFDVVALYRGMESDPRKRRAVASTLTNDFFRREFGRRVIDRMVERTQSERVDKNGRSFKGYSKAYADSLAGQVYGKKKGETADLTASGQMLANLEVIATPARSVVIGFTSQEQNDKAHGHVFGGGNLPVRDFFGLPKKEQEDILKDTLKDFNRDAELFFDIPPVESVVFIDEET